MKKLIIAIAFLAAVGMAGAAPRLSEPWLYRQVLIGFNACGVIAGDDHFDMNRLNRFCNEMADLPFAEHVMVFMASEHDMLIRMTKGVIAWVDRETDAAEALLLRVVKTWHDVLRSDPKLVEHWKAIMKVDPTMGPNACSPDRRVRWPPHRRVVRRSGWRILLRDLRHPAQFHVRYPGEPLIHCPISN